MTVAQRWVGFSLRVETRPADQHSGEEELRPCLDPAYSSIRPDYQSSRTTAKRTRQTLGTETWPADTAVREELYGPVEILQRTAAYVPDTGVPVGAYDDEAGDRCK